MMTMIFLSLAFQGKDQVLEVPITVSKQGERNYNVSWYTLRPPMALTGKTADAAALRESLRRGLAHLLKTQRQDGSWDPMHMRPGVRFLKIVKETAPEICTPVSATALACLALRAHQELAPARIRESVRKGLNYIMAQAETYRPVRYGVWSWSYSIEFLVEEHSRRENQAVKTQIREAAEKMAGHLLRHQHKGTAELPTKPWPGLAPSRPSLKLQGGFDGYLDLMPSDWDESSQAGALVMQVEPNGAAAQAGLKPGDRILEIGGIKVESGNHLFEVQDALKPGSTVMMKVLRVPGMEEKINAHVVEVEKRRRKRVESVYAGTPPDDGGWSYYQTEGMSFATATALLALKDAESIGIEIPKDAIDRGARLIESLRLVHPKTGETNYLYAWPTGATGQLEWDLRNGAGRVCVCELALARLGRRKAEDVRSAVDVFARRRGELDRVKDYPGTHAIRAQLNAAYAFMYGHYYAARCIAGPWVKDDRERKRWGSQVQEALLGVQNADGTWTDHEVFGTILGTSQALRALGELRFLADASAYASPIPELENSPR